MPLLISNNHMTSWSNSTAHEIRRFEPLRVLQKRIKGAARVAYFVISSSIFEALKERLAPFLVKVGRDIVSIQHLT